MKKKDLKLLEYYQIDSKRYRDDEDLNAIRLIDNSEKEDDESSITCYHAIKILLDEGCTLVDNGSRDSSTINAISSRIKLNSKCVILLKYESIKQAVLKGFKFDYAFSISFDYKSGDEKGFTISPALIYEGDVFFKQAWMSCNVDVLNRKVGPGVTIGQFKQSMLHDLRYLKESFPKIIKKMRGLNFSEDSLESFKRKVIRDRLQPKYLSLKIDYRDLEVRGLFYHLDDFCKLSKID